MIRYDKPERNEPIASRLSVFALVATLPHHTTQHNTHTCSNYVSRAVCCLEESPHVSIRTVAVVAVAVAVARATHSFYYYSVDYVVYLILPYLVPLLLCTAIPSHSHDIDRLDRESDMAALLEATRPALKDVLGKVYSMSRDQVTC